MKVRIASPTNLNGTYYLKNRYSGLNMDVAWNSTSDGANIDQWPNNGQTNQQFTFTYLGSSVYRIVAVNSGKALEVYQSSVNEGTKIVQNTFAGRSSQEFYVQSTGDGYYRLIASHSNKLIEVKDMSKSQGKTLQQWTAGDQLSGQWQLIPVSQGARISAPEAKQQTLDGKAKINLELFPNPAEGTLNIASSEDLSGAVVTIINSLGIKELSVSDINSQSLNISILRPGIYTLVITKNGHRASRRFIKSK